MLVHCRFCQQATGNVRSLLSTQDLRIPAASSRLQEKSPEARARPREARPPRRSAPGGSLSAPRAAAAAAAAPRPRAASTTSYCGAAAGRRRRGGGREAGSRRPLPPPCGDELIHTPPKVPGGGEPGAGGLAPNRPPFRPKPSLFPPGLRPDSSPCRPRSPGRTMWGSREERKSAQRGASRRVILSSVCV